MTSDHLPVVDGNRWCGQNVRAGVSQGYAEGDSVLSYAVTDVRVDCANSSTMVITLITTGGEVCLRCEETTLTVTDTAGRHPVWHLQADDTRMPAYRLEGNRLICEQSGFPYTVPVENGVWRAGTGRCVWELAATGDSLTLSLNEGAK